MLIELHVKDLGIVDDVTVSFGPGLTAITGETGAGKTLLVEALDLLLGGRADASLVRHGAPEARVEGRFDTVSGREIVLARVVPADARSRAYIDGGLASVTELAAMGAELVELHGQHAHQSLLAPAVQRSALDAFAGDRAIDARRRLGEARVEERQADAELAGLGGDERARARELDLLRFQIEEIERAEIGDAGEDVTLEAEEALLADAVAHREALGHAFAAIDPTAVDAVGEAVAALAERVPFIGLVDRLRAVQVELSDLERELRLAEEGILDDPSRRETVRGRRQLLRELQRKYGERLVDVVAYANQARARLLELESFETRAAALAVTRAEAVQRAEQAAAELSDARQAAGPQLGDAVLHHLRELAMPSAHLDVAVTATGVITDDGWDDVAFMLAANPGEAAKPLARAASGGELSRVMLSLRLVLSEAPPTLIFDEIDAGIGGEAGTAVGRLLADLGRRRQVLCVTHLAQVAAFAAAQVVVDKREEQGRTVASAAVVERDERVSELSRMLAGLMDSAHARSHAAELLDAAHEVMG